MEISQQTGIRLFPEDKEAIEAIKKHYGVISSNAAIRVALRTIRREIEKQVEQERKKKEAKN